MYSNGNMQDWAPVVLKSDTKKKRTNQQSTKVNTLLNDFDPESDMSVTKTSRSLGVSIQKARTAKGFKQSDLDKKCNLPKGTTQKYENGSAIYKPNVVNIMSRVLGVKLPRPTNKSNNKSK